MHFSYHDSLLHLSHNYVDCVWLNAVHIPFLCLDDLHEIKKRQQNSGLHKYMVILLCKLMNIKVSATDLTNVQWFSS